MKNPNFLKFGIASLAIAIMAFGLQSFTGEKTDSDGTIYYYISSSIAEDSFANVQNWSTANDLTPCSENGFRPCQLTVPEDVTLKDHIDGLSNLQVMALDPTRKP